MARILFFGTPEIAVPSLDACAALGDVALVVTQPDRPAGRGMTLAPPPVKVRAEALGLPVEQPTKVRTPDFAARLAALGADVGVVIAYGRILPRAVLDAPRLGCVNLHASILPRWRGASPIQRAIAAGDAETGVCLMKMDEGMDTGPVLACVRTPIDPDETSGALATRLGAIAAALLTRELGRYLAGALEARAQPDAGITTAPPIAKDDGRIDWSLRARAVHDHVRAMSPWPGAFTTSAGGRVRVHRTSVVAESDRAGEPGTLVRAARDGARVACGEGTIAIEELQLDGKRRMTAAEALPGLRWRVGLVLGEGMER
jgi:methionyl-tRNA formyltransferase